MMSQRDEVTIEEGSTNVYADLGYADAAEMQRKSQLAGEIARANGKEHFWVGMCGEMASDPLAAAMLIGMGIDELSMNAPSRPRVHEMIRSLDTVDAKAAIPEILALDDGADVKEYLKARFGK